MGVNCPVLKIQGSFSEYGTRFSAAETSQSRRGCGGRIGTRSSNLTDLPDLGIAMLQKFYKLWGNMLA